MDIMRKQIYDRFLVIYNASAVNLIRSVSDLVFGSCARDLWCANEGAEKKMESLKEIWGEIELAEMVYCDDESYGKALNAIKRKLTILELDNCDEASYREGLLAVRQQFHAS